MAALARDPGNAGVSSALSFTATSPPDLQVRCGRDARVPRTPTSLRTRPREACLAKTPQRTCLNAARSLAPSSTPAPDLTRRFGGGCPRAREPGRAGAGDMRRAATRHGSELRGGLPGGSGSGAAHIFWIDSTTSRVRVTLPCQHRSNSAISPLSASDAITRFRSASSANS